MTARLASDVLELESTIYNMPAGNSTMGVVLANTSGHGVQSVNGSAASSYQAILFKPLGSSNGDVSSGDQPIAGFFIVRDRIIGRMEAVG